MLPMPVRLMPRRYVPAHRDNRMKSEGDSTHARAAFLTQPSNNLTFLLRQRYAWMNTFIRPSDTAIEVGCGAGLAKFFIESRNLLLTEVVPHPWVDICLDAMRLPFGPSSVGVFICSNVLHRRTIAHSVFARCLRLLEARWLSANPGTSPKSSISARTQDYAPRGLVI